MPERLAIWIDIEGFSFLHENHNIQALVILGRLVEDLYLIGSQVYIESPDRLFIHQYGDGFIIVSDFIEDSPKRFLAIALVLMKSLLSLGGLARAGISSGDFADVSGCLPESVQGVMKDRGLPVGRGRMTITQVMGGALINAHKVAADGPRGPSLRIDSKFHRQLSGIDGLVLMDQTASSIGVNWLVSDLPLADSIAATIRGQAFDVEQLRKNLEWYIRKFGSGLKYSWIKTGIKLLRQPAPHRGGL